MSKFRYGLTFIVTASVLVSACGGGGGGSSPGTPSPASSPSSSSPGSSSGSSSSPTPSSTYYVSGAISGLVATGLVLQLNGGADLAVPVGTAFSFPSGLQNGTTYAVTVRTNPTGQVCSVTGNGAGSVAGADIANVAITCATPPAPPSSYTVGGSVSGLTATGLVLKNSTDSLNISGQSTQFTFPTALASGANYAVSIVSQPQGLTCGLTNASGTVTSANITGVTVTCTVTPTKVGLTIDKTSLTFIAEQGTQIASQTIVGTINGATAAPAVTVGYTVGLYAPVFSQISTTSGQIVVQPLSSQRPAGTYNDTIAITACYDAACTQPVSGSPIIVPVKTVITPPAPPPMLLISDHGVAFASVPGKSRTTRTLTVSDSSGSASTWTAASDQTWLAVTASGPSNSNLILTANPALLPDGLHLAKVTITSSNANLSSQVVRVGLYVSSVASATTFANSPALFSPIYWVPASNWVVDPIRPYTYVTSGSAINIDHVFTGARVGSISVPGADYKSAVTGDDGSLLYAVNAATGKIDIIDLDARALSASITMPAGISPVTAHTRPVYARVHGHPVLILGSGALATIFYLAMPIIDAQTGQQLGLAGAYETSPDYDCNVVSRDGNTLTHVYAGGTGNNWLTRYALAENSQLGVYGVFDATSSSAAFAASSLSALAVNADASRSYVSWYSNAAYGYAYVNGAYLNTSTALPNLPQYPPSHDDILNIAVNPYGDIVMISALGNIFVYDANEVLATKVTAGTSANPVGTTLKGNLRLSSDGLRMMGAGAMFDLR